MDGMFTYDEFLFHDKWLYFSIIGYTSMLVVETSENCETFTGACLGETLVL